MTAPSDQLAADLVSRLNAGSWSASFTAAKAFLPDQSVKSLKTLKVEVIPRREEMERRTRSAWTEQPTVSIVVRKKVGAEAGQVSVDDVDAIVNLAAEIAADLQTVTRLPNAGPITNIDRLILDERALHEDVVAVSVVTVTTTKL